jgi:hypothetical protein
VWFQIISELLINIAAAWFIVAFVEPYIEPARTTEDFLWLMFKILSGIITLFAAKFFREKSQRRKR